MDPNTLLLWIIAFSSFNLVWRGLRPGSMMTGWAGIGLIIILSTTAIWWYQPRLAGYIGGAAWLALVMIPMLLRLLTRRFTASQQFALASASAWLAAAIHPLDGFVRDAKLLGALSQWQRGKIDRARSSLDRLAARRSPGAVTAQCYRLRIDGQWNQIAAWLSTLDPQPLLYREPQLFPMYIRSLGEIGQIEPMLDEYHRLLPAMHTPQGRQPRLMAKMFVLAFGGRSNAVRQTISWMRPPMSRRQQGLWQATADAVVADPRATEIFRSLASDPDPMISQTAADRLHSPPTPAQNLSPRAQGILDRMEAELIHEAVVHLPAGRRTLPWATFTLIAANILMFIIEIRAGGSTNEDVLDKLGAMNAGTFSHHAYWRMLAANFLHYGIAHIAANMLALFILGPFVELSVGIGWYLLIYFVSGIGAMAGTTALGLLGLIHDDYLVGASGAIMGLVGATGAILLAQWLRYRAADIRRRLINILWIVALQVVFDTMTPMVSSSAHLIGLSLGFALGLAMSPLTLPKPALAAS